MLWLTLQQLKSKSPRTRKSAVKKLRRAGDPAAVEPLTQVLADDDAGVRKDAAEALGEFKEARAVESLIAALNDSSSDVREAVIVALKKIGDPRALNPLMAALRDINMNVRWRAAQALKTLGWQPHDDDYGTTYFVALGELEKAARMGPAAVEPLVALLKEGAYQKRVAAVEFLSEIGDSRVVKPLLAAFQDKDSLVRTAAANALSQVGDARAVEPLMQALRDPDHNVRSAAATALSKFGDERTVPPLIQTLKDKHWEVRTAALEALGKLRDPRSVEPMLRLLSDPDKEVRQHAAEALGQLGDEQAAEPLMLALIDEHSVVRQAAARALRRVDPYWERSGVARKVLPRIRAALEDKDHAVQYAAAEVLKALGDTPAVQTELATVTDGAHQKRHAAGDVFGLLLDDPDPDLRQAASESLGRIGDPRSIDKLVPVLDDRNKWVRVAALKALETLRWQPTEPEHQARMAVVQERWEEAASLGAAAVEPLLVALASGENRVRHASAVALGRIGDARAVEPLANLLGDKARAVRRAAAEALSAFDWRSPEPPRLAVQAVELGDWPTAAAQGAAAVEPLLALLLDREVGPDDLTAAEQTLAAINDPQAIGRLLACAQDGRVAAAVVAALQQIVGNHLAAVPEDELRQLMMIPNPARFQYEFDAASHAYARCGSEEVDCSLLRQWALEELARRGQAS